MNKSSKKLKREKWVPIPDFVGEYECSNHGRIRSLTKKVNGHNGIKVKLGRVLKQSIRNNYLFVKLSSRGKATAISAHVITAKLFVKNPMNKPTVNHLDGVKINNYYENLGWATRSEQIKHAIALGLFKPIVPTKKGDKLSDETKAKMSASRIGKKLNKKSRLKISQSLIKWYNSQKQSS